MATAMPARTEPTCAAPRHWLTAERVRLYACAFLIAHLGAAIVYLILDLTGNVPDGKLLLGGDFRVFWSASHLALKGHGADAYQIDKLLAAEQAVTPSLTALAPWQLWFYPPTTLLFVAPLAVLPFSLSFFLFSVAGIAFYLFVLRAIIPRGDAVLPALAFSGVAFALVNGQNAFFTAGFAGLALVLLDRRPVLAGVLVGLLVIKPHLAVLFVIALASAKRWDVLWPAAGTALALALASLAIFSPESGAAFLHQLHVAKSLAEDGLLPLNKMPTMFASARLLGLSTAAANALHVACALVVAVVVARIWARKPAPYLRNCALILGTLLISPHLYDYDLVWLAWPIAWLAKNGLENGWRRGERELLLLAWLSPMLGGVLSYVTVHIGPLICLAMLALVAGRARLPSPALPASLSGTGAHHVT